MTYEDVRDALMLEAAIKGLETTGDMNPSLQPYWEEYQKSKPGAEPGPEFVAEMRKILEEQQLQGQGQYSPPPAQAGPPKFDWKSFLTKKPWTNE